MSTRREGFTLIEMMIALVIFAVVILGMATATGRFVRVVREADQGAAAVQLAMDRVQLIQVHPAYATLDSVFTAVETAIPGFPDYERETVVQRTLAGDIDFTTVTVRVTAPTLPAPIARTVVLGAP